MENILVCLAWPYANGDQHVGHITGAYLPGDIFARFQRLKGPRGDGERQRLARHADCGAGRQRGHHPTRRV